MESASCKKKPADMSVSRVLGSVGYVHESLCGLNKTLKTAESALLDLLGPQAVMRTQKPDCPPPGMQDGGTPASPSFEQTIAKVIKELDAAHEKAANLVRHISPA